MDYKSVFDAIGIYSLVLFLFLGVTDVAGQSKVTKESISSSYNQDKIKQLISTWEDEQVSKAGKIGLALKSKGWKKSEKMMDGSIVSVQEMGTDGTPIFYTTLSTSTGQSSRANALHTNGLLNLGLDGSGMEVGVWDAGAALSTHQEFGGRAFNSDHSDEISLHGTLVTGTLISAGVKPDAKGTAYGATALTHDWTRDKIEVAQAAAQGLLLSNHSYGIKTDRVPDWYFGSYIKVSQDWDKIMYNAPYYLMVTAAGNAQNSFDNAAPNFGKTADGFDLLLGFAVSKNGLTIAGANTQVDNKGELKEATVAGYSSFGPVDDGRIKPDLAGEGSAILSTGSAHNASYEASAGTSMAAPTVTGSLLLLQQYHEELFGGFMKAATLKGLALHTADDVEGKGPDYKMGWGVMNAKTAAEVLQNREYTTLINEESIADGQTFSITVTANGHEPLMASISWTDPEGEHINRGELNATTPSLMNDLDIRITKEGEAHLPWKLNPAKANDAATRGDNKVDPYERIDVPQAHGVYTITVSHKGALKNGIQDFSLIVTGAQVSLCDVEIPSGLDLASSNSESTTITWSEAEETLFEVQYRMYDTDSWNSELLWENSAVLSNLEPGKIYEARVRSICSENAVSDFSETIEFEFNGEETQLYNYETLSFTNGLEVSVYPNPAVEQLTVHAELSKDAEYCIVTTSGNIIKKGGLNGSINVSSLSSGLYVLVVQDYAGIKSTKFYKN
ncbi:S8 family serine peptidase [Flagellimonas meishanensis]|uniref:S8 family serine peptidase n=1 Tax=Flagellimonas meishanensis TaxID=2873264 RepID=UPI001CA72F9E|nr:S8 family serine peptidase [[Muricauda] meishanensis]